MNRRITTESTAAEQLARLERQEQEISAQRQLIHARIDRLYSNAKRSLEESAALRDLEALEDEISAQRRKLHRDIDKLRAECGLPPWRLRGQTNTA